MKTIFLSLAAFFGSTLLFIAINNIPRIPGEICVLLWYGFVPFSAGAIAFAYGSTAGRSGGGILTAALFLAPLLWLSAAFPLPFSSVFWNIPTLLAAIPCAILGETVGKSKEQRKRKVQNPSPQTK